MAMAIHYHANFHKLAKRCPLPVTIIHLTDLHNFPTRNKPKLPFIAVWVILSSIYGRARDIRIDEMIVTKTMVTRNFRFFSWQHKHDEKSGQSKIDKERWMATRFPFFSLNQMTNVYSVSLSIAADLCLRYPTIRSIAKPV